MSIKDFLKCKFPNRFFEIKNRSLYIDNKVIIFGHDCLLIDSLDEELDSFCPGHSESLLVNIIKEFIEENF